MRNMLSAGFAVALIVTLAAAGCGGGSGAPAPASGAGTGPAAASTAPSAASVGAGNGGATGGPVAAGGDLCGLLGPGGFAAAGVAGAGTLTSNSTPPTDYYCVYAGKSSGTGGIELDAFLLASADDPDGVFATVLNEIGILDRTDRAADVGAKGAAIATNLTSDTGKLAIIAVRKGPLVFDIGFPAGPDAERQLIDLAKLVLQRAAGLTG